MYNSLKNRYVVMTSEGFKKEYNLVSTDLISMCNELLRSNEAEVYPNTYLEDRACFISCAIECNQASIKLFALLPTTKDLNRLDGLNHCAAIEVTLCDDAYISKGIEHLSVDVLQYDIDDDYSVYNDLSAKDIYTMLKDFKSFHKLPLVNVFSLSSPYLLEFDKERIRKITVNSYTDIVGILGRRSDINALIYDKGVCYISKLIDDENDYLIYAEPEYILDTYSETFITNYYLLNRDLSLVPIDTKDLNTVVDTNKLFILKKFAIQYEPVVNIVHEDIPKVKNLTVLNSSPDVINQSSPFKDIIGVDYARKEGYIEAIMNNRHGMKSIRVRIFKAYLDEYTTDFSIIYSYRDLSGLTSDSQMLTSNRYFNTMKLLRLLDTYFGANTFRGYLRSEQVAEAGIKFMLSDKELEISKVQDILAKDPALLIISPTGFGSLKVAYKYRGYTFEAEVCHFVGFEGDYLVRYSILDSDTSALISLSNTYFLSGTTVKQLLAEYTKRFSEEKDVAEF